MINFMLSLDFSFPIILFDVGLIHDVVTEEHGDIQVDGFFIHIFIFRFASTLQKEVEHV